VGFKGADLGQVEHACVSEPASLLIPSRVPPAMEQIEVVRKAHLKAGDSIQGILRKKAFDVRGITVAQTQVPAKVASGWHHHGQRNLYGFVVAGRLHLEYGPDGALVADVGAGEFVHVPPRLIHRDVNPNQNEAAIMVNITLGEGTPFVNVDGPNISRARSSSRTRSRDGVRT